MTIKQALEVYNYCYDMGTVTLIPADWMITENFSWEEAFRNELRGDGVPFYDVFLNISRAAERFQRARNHLGKPMVVHSWYRSVNHNKRVGSVATLSCHLQGTALDFHVDGVSDEAVRQSLLNSDISLRIEKDTTGWVHIDTGCPYIQGGYSFGLF